MKDFLKGVLVTLLVLAYFIFPDVLPGPIDDLIVAIVAIVSTVGKDKFLKP